MTRLSDEECRALVARYVPNGDVYPLWGFIVDNKNALVTRGRTQEEAQEYLQMTTRPGTILEALPHLPPDTGRAYSINHEHGWLERPPIWILRRMFGV